MILTFLLRRLMQVATTSLVVLLFSIPPLSTFAQSPVADDFNPGANNLVSSLTVQADGKILVGGDFTMLGGQPRNRIGRLNADGTLDTDFNPGTDNLVFSLAVQTDGKILVGGDFTMLGGQPRNRIGRLNADGTLDTDFNPGADNLVFSLAVQADGKILVGGNFTMLGGQPRNRIGRLNKDGTLDTDFNPGANNRVLSLAVQTDGKILVGGYFTMLGGQPRNRIGRLNKDGTLDTDFNPGANAGVSSLALQADGKILVGGEFSTLGGQPRSLIGRLNTDGTLDPDFNPGADDWVNSLAVQTDGKILVGGYFTTLGGQSRNRVGRLNTDGTLDDAFNPGVDNGVLSLAMQADGKILVGGNFTTLGGEPRNRIGRLNNTAPATQSLAYDETTITWLRGGTSPEVWRTTFESSPDGMVWTELGAGTRISGGWQLTGVTLPADQILRARGHVSDGSGGWPVEALLGRLAILAQPASRTNDAGTTATFYVTLTTDNTEHLSFQWYKDGVLLGDGGNISGVQTSKLEVKEVLKGDEGDYTVVVANQHGSLKSQGATLTVRDPLITVQPVSQNREAGGNVAFSVTALGTSPLGYQWSHQGMAIPGATNATLTLTNLQGADAGEYFAVVSNAYDRAVSATAFLTVNVVTLDSDFNPGVNPVSLALQADGKILVGGEFSTLGGQPRDRIGRLNGDGTLDSAFNPGANNGVLSLALQADGKILVGGDFTMLGGQPRNRIGRLNADGTLDSAFNPGADGGVLSLAVQADGKILVGGDFTMLGGQPRNRIGRLNEDGTLDTDFNPGADGGVLSLALQADGKILVGGDFTILGGQPRNRIGRLNEDGTLDTDFNPGANGGVSSLAVQADGKILVGGYFTTLDGQSRDRIGRLNEDGTLDTDFNPGADGGVLSLALQADGKILVGGEFSTLGGQQRNSIGRLNADGSPDFNFNPRATGANWDWVASLVVQADGKILVEGEFSGLGGHPRNGFGRLNNTAPATQSVAYDGSTITWLRGGTGPEVDWTLFETNSGTVWALAGYGERVADGWKLSGVSLAQNATIRARGRIVGSPGGWVETLVGAPQVVISSRGTTNAAGTELTLRTYASGSTPLVFQWFKDGQPLNDDLNLTGAHQADLTISNLLKADAGDYWLVVSNSFGQAVSPIAVVEVLDPSILSQPVGLQREIGQGAVLEVHAAGTGLRYQWIKAEAEISGATNSVLAFDHLTVADAGQYQVQIIGDYGVVVSQVVRLSVNGATWDTSFIPPRHGTSRLAVQLDGKVVYDAGSQIGRLNSDGTEDASFNRATFVGHTLSLAIQNDDKILLGGMFSQINGQLREGFGRLDPNGSLDTEFNPLSGEVHAVLVLPDGKLLVGGTFDTLGGIARRNLARFHANGSLDQEFDAGSIGSVYALGLHDGGKLIVMANGKGIARLHPNGPHDTEFSGPQHASSYTAITVQSDGKIVLIGDFTTIAGQRREGIARLNSDGTLDPEFNPGAGDGFLFSRYALAPQADGRVLVGGGFQNLGGEPRPLIGRLDSKGSVDVTFTASALGFRPFVADALVTTLVVQADGKVLVGGNYVELAGKEDLRGLGRLNATDPAIESLAYSEGTLTWLRGGSSPEIAYAVFDYSTDGDSWQRLTDGVRIAGGWQVSGLSIPENASIRARGYISGDGGASGGWVGSLLDSGSPSPNTAPTFPHPIVDFVAPEGAEILLTNSPEDADVPAQGLVVVLTSPAGISDANYDISTGIFRWTPDEVHGPGQYDFALVVSDDGTPPLSTTNGFRITVTEVNLPPTVDVPAELRGHEGDTLEFAILATDPDRLADGQTNRLLFELAPLPPSAAFDAEAGIFLWTIPVGTTPGTNVVQVTVKDDGEPPLEAKGVVILVVEPPPVFAFTIENVRFDSGTGSVVFELRLPLGTSYVVERAQAVDDPSWEPAGSGSVISDPTTVVVPADAAAQGFLRIRLQ